MRLSVWWETPPLSIAFHTYLPHFNRLPPFLPPRTRDMNMDIAVVDSHVDRAGILRLGLG